MSDYSIFMPNYTIGEHAYSQIPGICRPYGRKIAVVGGHKAMAAIQEELDSVIDPTEMEILAYVWYGGECSYENIDMLTKTKEIQDADMIFAVGGGKATDTAKALGEQVGKPVFALPTIASNCSGCTSVSIMYHPDGSFFKPFFLSKPPVHTFISLTVIAKSPRQYMWAGMGDTYAKYFECTISSRGERLSHYVGLGAVISRMCLDPILDYGKKALEDNEQGQVSQELEQVVLAIIVTTALVSILVTRDRIIDYNTGLAHGIYYALTSFPEIEEGHLHGEVVGFGVLVLLLVDGQEEMFQKLYDFNQSVGLPTCLGDMNMTAGQLPQVIEKTLEVKDIDHNPYVITASMLEKAFARLEAYKM